MNLSQLENTPGSHKKRKRIGCGPGSGHGKTSCRGGKGQFARTGKSHRRGFEGGQTPLYRRLPKRGFTNIFARDYEIVNVDALNRFPAGTEVTPELVYSSGIAKEGLPLKILGKGKLEQKLTVVAHKFSKSAKELIEKAGGSCKEI
jgi:large subunit ribosomal protein L15